MIVARSTRIALSILPLLVLSVVSLGGCLSRKMGGFISKESRTLGKELRVFCGEYYDILTVVGERVLIRSGPGYLAASERSIRWRTELPGPILSVELKFDGKIYYEWINVVTEENGQRVDHKVSIIGGYLDRWPYGEELPE